MPSADAAPAHSDKEMNVRLVRIGSTKDVVPGQMRVFDLNGTKVNVASAGGNLYAFDRPNAGAFPIGESRGENLLAET